MNKRLIWNIIQIILGAGMLFLSYIYVSMNEVEKTNFASGITILKQKISTRFGGFKGEGDQEDATSQQQTIRDYKELLSFIKSGKEDCFSDELINEFTNMLTEIENLTPTKFIENKQKYQNYASNVYTKVDACHDKSK